MPANEVAAVVGLRDRYMVRDVLHRAGLPSYRVVSGWCRVVAIALEMERTGLSATALALRDGINQDAYTGLARRIVGEPGALGTGPVALLILMKAAFCEQHRSSDGATTEECA